MVSADHRCVVIGRGTQKMRVKSSPKQFASQAVLILATVHGLLRPKSPDEIEEAPSVGPSCTNRGLNDVPESFLTD